MKQAPAATRADPPLWAMHLLMLVAATLVSTSFTVGKAIATGLDPVILTLVRFGIATLLFVPCAVRKTGPGRRPALRDLGRYSMISGVLVLFFWFMFEALRTTTALNTSVIFTLVPGISGMYSAIILHERLGRYRLTALGLAMTGALWVIFRGDLHRLISLEMGQGDLIFFAGCLFMAAYTPLVRLLHRGESMVTMTFWVLATGCGWLLLIGLPRLPGIEWQSVTTRTWAGIAYLAVFCTIVTFFLTHYVTMRLGPTRVMAYSYLYPPLVLGIDWLLGNPLPGLWTGMGVPVIVGAMIIVQRGASARSQQPESVTKIRGFDN